MALGSVKVPTSLFGTGKSVQVNDCDIVLEALSGVQFYDFAKGGYRIRIVLRQLIPSAAQLNRYRSLSRTGLSQAPVCGGAIGTLQNFFRLFTRGTYPACIVSPPAGMKEVLRFNGFRFGRKHQG